MALLKSIILRNFGAAIVATYSGLLASCLHKFLPNMLARPLSDVPDVLSVMLVYILLGAVMSPYFIIIASLYSIPLSTIVSCFSRSQAVRDKNYSLVTLVITSSLLGLLYWTLIQTLIPLYSSTHAREEMRFACYVGSTLGGAFLGYRVFKTSFAEQDAAPNL